MNQLSLKEGLKKVADIKSGDISISRIIKELGENAAKIIIIIFSAPTALPTPALPVLTQILSMVVIITLAQLVVRRQNIWLPKKIAEKKISHESVSKASKKILHYHSKIERFVRPRVRIMSLAPLDMLIYIFCIFLSVVVALPLPFSNTVPSIAIIIIMLGQIERDGFITIAGVSVGIAGVVGLFLFYYFGYSIISG